MRDYIGKKKKKIIKNQENNILQIFVKAYQDEPYKKIISSIPHQRKYIESKIKLGNGGQHPNHTGKLERNFQQQWKTTNSPLWREFSWKNIIRHLCTPY